MKNITPENISHVEEYKKYINDLSKVQDKLFTDLENLLELDDDKMNDYVFDYIYNGDESSFEEYLARFGPK